MRAFRFFLPTAPCQGSTFTGVLRRCDVPSPSWPVSLDPQHLAAPPVVTAQVWASPAEMLATPLVSPETWTGVVRSVPVPSPSPPAQLYPQHIAAPPVVTAQV